MTKTVKKSKRTAVKKDSSKKSAVMSAVKAAAVSILVFFVLMLLFSVLVSKREISGAMMKIIPFFVCAVSGAVGGIIVSKNIKEKTLVYCLISSIIESVVICIALFIFVGTIGLKTLFASATVILFSIVSAALRLGKKPKRKI